jgi:Ca-activated chloride channel family protein
LSPDFKSFNKLNKPGGMNMKGILSLFMLFAVLCTAAGPAASQKEPAVPGGESRDRTLSPYFFVENGDPDVDRLPLKSTAADVDINGVIADVKVTQVYRNEGTRPIEAVYVFPASTRAAVHGMKMKIGNRTIVAEIRERKRARRDYQQAKRDGKSASLLEQQRPNVFQMNVANIMPGDQIRVELSYTELLTPSEGVYEFDYPTVVGPRYSGQTAETAGSSDKWVQSPYLHEGKKPPYSFGMKVNLATGIPIKEITSPSHRVDISYRDPSRAEVLLSPDEKDGGNRDFILKYRLSGNSVESGLLLSRGEKENYFLMMLEPPRRITSRMIPPREFIFIIDVSGSMHGFPLDISKKLMEDLMGHLRPVDRFNVLLFSGGSSLLSDTSLPATPENISRAMNVIDRQQGGGGTELLPALRRALALPRADGSSRTVVIVTDGYVNVETEAFDLIRKSLGKANMFAFGIGSSVNRYLMEGIARAGMGEPFVVTKPGEARAAAEKFRTYIQSPVLTNVRIDFDGLQAYDIEPPAVPDLLAERPVVVFGKWRGAAHGSITVRGISGDRKYEKTLDVGAASTLKDSDALRYLWARHRIAALGDYEKLEHSDERVAEITSLGLAHSLLTAFTSFVAIDSEVRRASGDLTTVPQPLPLPQGVSDLAVGDERSAPAPYTMAAGQYAVSRQKAEKPVRENMETKRADKKTVGVSIDVKGMAWQGAAPEGELHSGGEAWRPYLEDIKACYETFLARHPDARGRLTLKLEIGPDGRVGSVTVISDALKQPEMERMIVARVKKWIFADARNKGITTLILPLILTHCRIGR